MFDFTQELYELSASDFFLIFFCKNYPEICIANGAQASKWLKCRYGAGAIRGFQIDGCK